MNSNTNDMVEVKRCPKCGEEKPLDEFNNCKSRKDGKDCYCKKCKKEKLEKNKQIIHIYEPNQTKKCACCGEEKLMKEFIIDKTKKDGKRSYCNKCNKEKLEKYKQIIHIYEPNQTKKCTCCGEEKLMKEFYNDKNQRDRKNYHCKKCANKYTNTHKTKKYNTNSLYKIKERYKKIISKCFKNKGYKKNIKTEKILGYSFEEFKKYIEKQFEPWMSWDNYGKYNGEYGYGWDIDHIIPMATAKTEEEMIKLNHYTNLQPLDSHINRDIKRDRTDYVHGH